MQRKVIQLRDYQQDLAGRSMTSLKTNRRVIMQCPTGGGKTVIFNHIAEEYVKQGGRALIIADRRELIMQAWKRLWEATGICGGIILAGQKPMHSARVQVASIQTLNRRTFPKDIDLVIIDECRGSTADSYKPVFDFYHDAHVLGVDATPVRANGLGFDHLYKDMILGPTIKYMESIGSLVPARVFSNPIDARLLDKVRVTAGDYNEKDLSTVMLNQRITADLVTSKKRHAPGLPTMVFAVSIAHSKSIVAQYRAAGIDARHIDGEMNIDMRTRILEDFEKGVFEVLSNVGIATYGYDNPKVRCIQLARPTMSVALYLQMCGRGTRPLNGKDHYVLLDNANCIANHLPPNAERKWSLYGTRPVVTKKKKPQDMIIVPGSGGSSTALQQSDKVELVEVTEQSIRAAAIQNLFQISKKKGYKSAWVYYRFCEQFQWDVKPEDLQMIEKTLQFKSGWWKFKVEEVAQKRAALLKTEN